MIKHIVMWKLKEENKAENAKEIKTKLEALINQVPEIISIEVGIDFNKSDQAYDVVLYSEFATAEDLDRYQENAIHKEAAAFVKQVVTQRVVVDYEV